MIDQKEVVAPQIKTSTKKIAADIIAAESRKAVALDYDDTLTSNPYAWLAVAAILHNSGFDVYIVTYRYDNAEESTELEYLKHYDYISGIVFTGRKAKDKTCRDLGIYVSIWIDDNPITITHTMKSMLNSYTPLFKSETHHAIDLTVH